MSEHDTRPGDGAADAAPEDTTPSIEASLRQFGAAGREGLDATLDTGRALRRLLFADLALARAALARALVWLTVAVAFGGSAWLLLMGVVIALLQAMGWSWLASISFAALISLMVTGIGAWQALRYFEMSRLQATRRQLARLGIGGDGDADTDDEDEAVPPASSQGAPTP
ncbi:phage holin family protein [Stenotrophomonas sp. MMGLT7]|uniref:phage holin family protein n=1 Tax=Stenotrophomonas sp. MMGLT7 TaxID=2901227 RepID=UPI001E62D66D|nr:phage holin family protein [Stenotrophomonas sp. MMGLT7]